MAKHIIDTVTCTGLAGGIFPALDRILTVGQVVRERATAPTPAYVNHVTGGQSNASTPSVFTFTPGTGGTYVLLKSAVTGGTSSAVSATCVPTSGPTISLVRLFGQVATNSYISMWGAAEFQVGIAYTVTITYTGAAGSGSAWVMAAYKDVGSVKPVTVAAAGSTTPMTLNVTTNATFSLVTDMATYEAQPHTFTPTQAGQTAEAYQIGGTVEIATSWRVATSTTTAMGWSTSPSIGSASAWQAAIELSGTSDLSTEARSETGTAFTLLDATTDRYYLGYDAKFPGIRVGLDTLGSGLALVWEYWNGTAWTALANVSGPASGLTASGTVTWDVPANWAKTTVLGTSLYFVRVRTTTVTTAPTAFYTVVNWTIYDPAAGTNAKVYKSIGEDGTANILLWVNDNQTSNCYVRLYEAWNAVAHTGTDPTPTVAQTANGCSVQKSTSADGTVRLITANVSRDFLIVAIAHGGVAGVYFSSYMGKFLSRVPADPYAVAILTGSITASTTASHLMTTTSPMGVVSGAYLQRNFSGASKSLQAAVFGPMGTYFGAGGWPAFPDPCSGAINIGSMRLVDGAGGVGGVRGTLLGHVVLLHTSDAAITNGTTFTDPATGTVYWILKIGGIGSQQLLANWIALEVQYTSL